MSARVLAMSEPLTEEELALIVNNCPPFFLPTVERLAGEIRRLRAIVYGKRKRRR